MRSLALALTLITTTAAFADPPEDEPTAAPGSIATGMIETANAEGVFDIVHNGHVSVRHLGSGLTCHFLDSGDGSQLVLFPGLQRGEDVACDTNNGGEAYTLYATRYPLPTSAEEQIAGAEAAIRHRWPDARLYPSAMDVTVDGAPPSRTAEFIVMRDGVRSYTSAAVAIVNGWTIKLRYTAPAPDDDAARQAELIAGALFSSALTEILRRPNL